ncbi:MAG TPA: TylF/MycF/NovP-related O-methyltransferase [Bacteroidia bacterium]|nr:TylF/MycF/NovP-related O-methyltransferase [Bacteroidia bacterium]
MPQPFQSLYIELLKKSLIDYSKINSYEYHPLKTINANWKTTLLYPLDKLLRKRNFAICKLQYVSEENRLYGYDWPANADTMIGMNRLNNIEHCIYSVINENIEGDFIETGVWRGGATILMRGILKELKITDRKVWVADSFTGLPKPDVSNFKADKGNKLHTIKILRVSSGEVKNNFKKYGLLDEQVIFLEGWFKDTLPKAPIKKLALLRLDGDLYESTIQALQILYPKLSVGGYVIIDDFNAFANCRHAVIDYRKDNNIFENIIEIDREAVYWRRAK